MPKATSSLFGIYNRVAFPLMKAGAGVASLVSEKLRKTIEGRKDLQLTVERHYSVIPKDRLRVLAHVASFGELEQAKPVIECLKERYPTCHIHLTFFSPSGYENAAGRYKHADLITYSPIDDEECVRDFLDLARPDIVLFARYDVWPNFAMELARRSVPTLLFSATGGLSSGRFMPLVKGLHRDVYGSLSHICAIGDEDRAAFVELGIDATRVSVSGDTRFDQVVARKHAIASAGTELLPPEILARIEERGTFVFVAGSIWPKDLAVMKRSIAASLARHDNVLYILVPHEPDDAHVKQLMELATGDCIRLSNIEQYARESVIVVDSIGKLFGLYRYADAAYVGGGFGAGVHNLLECAVWGKPSMLGPKHERSREAGELIRRVGAFEVRDAREFEFVFWRLLNDQDLRESAGAAASGFVETGCGATSAIMDQVTALI